MSVLRRVLAGLTLPLFILAGCQPGPERSAMAQMAYRDADADAGGTQSFVEVRRVWVGSEPFASGGACRIACADPSPDGHLVTEIDWNTGDLAVRDLETGELRHVTNKGSWADSNDFADRSVFSPDGRQIAYGWFNENTTGFELRVIAVDGSGQRVLLSQGESIYGASPHDWSPDGKKILTTIARPDRTLQLTLVAADGGSSRALKTFGWVSGWRFRAEFSPDGRYIAYDFPVDRDSEDRDIYVLAADGSREATLVKRPGNDMLLGWVPGGHDILFYSDRSGTPGIWQLPFSDGRPAGEPRLVRGDVWGLSPLGFSRDAYFYGVTVEQRQVHTATIDLGTGKLLSPPKPVTGPTTARFTLSPDWSPDGEKLAYLAGIVGMQTRYLVIRSATGDETRQIALDVGGARAAHWSPDGQSVVVLGRNDKGKGGLWRVDLRKGTSSLLYAPETPIRGFAFSRDGKTAYFGRITEGTGGGAIVARDLATGQEREIARVSQLMSISLSPDGRTLAFVEYDRPAQLQRLKLVPVAGGEVREINATRGINHVAGLPWTPDGSHLLFSRWGSRFLWKIPTAGGEPQEAFEIDMFGLSPPEAVRLHPNGRRLAFRAGRDKGEIWVMENFLPIDSLQRSSVRP